MKTNLRIIPTLLALSLSALSLSSMAGNEPVNCRDVNIPQAIYAGWASCNVSGNNLQQYFGESTVQHRWITQPVNGSYYQCIASVPYFRTVNVTQRVCDYKPSAFLGIARLPGTTDARVYAKGSDSDGSIAKLELFINGVKQSSYSKILTGYSGQTFTVKSRATDNDGYTSDYTESVTLRNDDVMCGPVAC